LKRIAVIGASGFVGATLVERLLAQGADVVPFIHGSGNAWRIGRRGIDLHMLDVLDATAVERSLQGITHVVNCSRGGNDVMLTGLRNVLRASRRGRVRRLIHLGSVAVYGDPPPAASVRETAPTAPARDSYGWIKLQQDRMVAKAAREGLSALILCPPNISGPYSTFLIGLAHALCSGGFALLDDGSAPCNLVDVSNLSHAIELALANGPDDGSRLFITDDQDTDWRLVVENLMPLVHPQRAVAMLSRNELERLPNPLGRRPISLSAGVKHLLSSEVRSALRKDPLWERVDAVLRVGVTRMGRSFESMLRSSIEGPLVVARSVSTEQLNIGLCRQQLRGVRHSSQSAKNRLGYHPLYTFSESMAAFRRWYKGAHGMDSDAWSLLTELHG